MNINFILSRLSQIIIFANIFFLLPGGEILAEPSSPPLIQQDSEPTSPLATPTPTGNDGTTRSSGTNSPASSPTPYLSSPVSSPQNTESVTKTSNAPEANETTQDNSFPVLRLISTILPGGFSLINFFLLLWVLNQISQLIRNQRISNSKNTTQSFESYIQELIRTQNKVSTELSKLIQAVDGFQKASSSSNITNPSQVSVDPTYISPQKQLSFSESLIESFNTQNLSALNAVGVSETTKSVNQRQFNSAYTEISLEKSAQNYFFVVPERTGQFWLVPNPTFPLQQLQIVYDAYLRLFEMTGNPAASSRIQLKKPAEVIAQGSEWKLLNKGFISFI